MKNYCLCCICTFICCVTSFFSLQLNHLTYLLTISAVTLLQSQSESPSDRCAKLYNVAASNNRDHAPQSFFAYASHWLIVFIIHMLVSWKMTRHNQSIIIACSHHNSNGCYFLRSSCSLYGESHILNTTPTERLQ